jgi:hypothetical protein
MRRLDLRRLDKERQNFKTEARLKKGHVQLYSDEGGIDVTEQHLRFNFIDKMASDFGGVSREVYSSFWKECSRCFSKAMICHLCPDVVKYTH